MSSLVILTFDRRMIFGWISFLGTKWSAVTVSDP